MRDPDSPIEGWGTPPPWLTNEPLNIHSQVYVNSLVVKTGPGYLFGIAAYSSRSSSQWIQVFDTNTVPADGAIPAAIFVVLATSNLDLQWVPPRTFLTGCVICNSTTGPTKTIGSADTWLDVQFL